MALTSNDVLRLTGAMRGESSSQPPTGGSRDRSQARWIVGVDGSECSRHAALWAAQNVAGRAEMLHLETAWSVPVASAMAPMGASFAAASCDELERSAQTIVEDVAHAIEPGLDVPVTTGIRHGGAAQVLLDVSDDGSLLVIGSRGRGGFTRLVVGSTSAQCATHSAIPVAVVPDAAPLRRVRSMVAAFDGSPNSAAALRWAIDFADASTSIECVSVWDTSPIAVGADQFFFPDASDLARQRFEHLVAQTAAERRRDVEIRPVFLEGAPRTMLADRATEADLLVMGTRGHGAIGSALLGSVSTWLLHHVPRPMVVVPHP